MSILFRCCQVVSVGELREMPKEKKIFVYE